MKFILRVVANVLVLLITFIIGLGIYDYIHLNFFTAWTPSDAWLVAAVITGVACMLISGVLFSISDALLRD